LTLVVAALEIAHRARTASVDPTGKAGSIASLFCVWEGDHASLGKARLQREDTGSLNNQCVLPPFALAGFLMSFLCQPRPLPNWPQFRRPDTRRLPHCSRLELC